MALSCLSHPNFQDLQTFLDPIRSSFDFSTTGDQMEYHNNNSAAINQHLNHSNTNNTSNSNRNYNNFAANQTQNAFNNDYVINFVDSPPNSEESWTDEQHQQQQTQQQQQQQQNNKIQTAGPRIIDVQTIFGQQQQQQQQQQVAAAAAASAVASGQRKRRMDWNPLEINQNVNSGTDSQSTAAKIPNLTNGNASNQNNNNNNNVNNNINKEKDKKKISNGNGSGRGSWADDIDFDLNTDFNSSGYLNNEPFLSFSPALTVLKQEIHSPQAEQLKGNKSPLNPVNQDNSLSSDNHDTDHQVNGTSSSDLNDSSTSCASPSRQVVAKSGYDNSKSLNINGFSVNNNNNNQQTTDDKSLINARKSPIQPIVVDSSKSENNSASSLADDYKFQYILAAATSIATKNNEETLTYLNQGQSYEIKLKKTGDLSFYRDKILKSVIKICFHERRLQYMEREQMQQWQASRPGERIIEVDVPLSYGLCHVSQPLNPNFLNTVEVFWDPLKEVGVYIKVNCISTEFTPKKHGGEKGVPFRIQIETYIENANNSPIGGDSTTNCNNIVGGGGGGASVVGGSAGVGISGGKQAIHAAACQIKVFKLKGADRKHKQDREKIQRRPVSEQEKFQPSYECTIMNDIPLDTLPSSAGCYSPEYNLKLWPNSPVHIPKYDGIIPYANVSPTANSSPIAINSVTSTNTNNLKLMDANMVSPQQPEIDDYQSPNIMAESTPAQVTQWLTYHRLITYVSTFAHFSGADVLRMSKDDLIQICGLADGIRMFNILHTKALAPRLTIYISLDGNSYNAIYLTSSSAKELTQKIFKLPGFYELSANSSNMNGAVDGGVYPNWGMQSKYSGSGSNIFNDASKTPVYITGPSGVHVTITDEVLNNEIKDGSLFALEVQNGKVLMKAVNKNE